MNGRTKAWSVKKDLKAKVSLLFRMDALKDKKKAKSLLSNGRDRTRGI